MKGRSSCNQSNICLCQRISICYFYQLSQHHLRCCFYMQDVFSALAITRSQYIAHNPDHDIIIFFFFVNLIINHIYQMLLVHIETQGILNSFLYNHRIKRSSFSICCSSLLIASTLRRYCLIRRSLRLPKILVRSSSNIVIHIGMACGAPAKSLRRAHCCNSLGPSSRADAAGRRCAWMPVARRDRIDFPQGSPSRQIGRFGRTRRSQRGVRRRGQHCGNRKTWGLSHIA